MNINWDLEANTEMKDIGRQNYNSGIAVARIYCQLGHFAANGVPNYSVACPSVKAIQICYWPSTDIKGFFGYDDKTLFVAHFAMTQSDFELGNALDIAADRYLLS